MGITDVKLKIKCPKCKGEYNAFINKVEKEDVLFEKLNGGELIHFQYFNCPECRAKNYVQADNSESISVLDECKKQVVRQITLNRKGRRGKQSGKARKSRTHLENIRKSLCIMLVTKYKISFANYEVITDESKIEKDTTEK